MPTQTGNGQRQGTDQNPQRGTDDNTRKTGRSVPRENEQSNDDQDEDIGSRKSRSGMTEGNP